MLHAGNVPMAGVLRPERAHRKLATGFQGRWLAVLPGTSRDAAFRLHKVRGSGGFAVESVRGEVVGHCELFGENLIHALHMADCLPRNPEGMASFLEAAGPLGLERAGAVLDSRVG